MNTRDIPSPCVQVCQLDPVSKLCLGCYRSIEEISDWLELSMEQKQAVLARVEARRHAHLNTQSIIPLK